MSSPYSPTHRRDRRPTLAALPAMALLPLLTLLSACADPPPAPQEEIAATTHLTIFAPPSLRTALTELTPLVRQVTGLDPDFHFADSQTLTRQIEVAATPDVLLVSGDEALAPLAAAGRLLPHSRRRFLANRLVVLAHPASDLEIRAARELETATYDRLALGDPREAPDGVDAKSFLQAVVMPGGHTLWQAVGERIDPVADAESVVAAVADDPGTLGIVYASTATGAKGVRVLFDVPAELSPRIRYVAVGLTGGPAGEAAARAFLDLLESPTARRLFERSGFGAPPAARRRAPDPPAKPTG